MPVRTSNSKNFQLQVIEIQNYTATLKDSLAISLKSKDILSYDATIALLQMFENLYPRQNLNTDVYNRVHIVPNPESSQGVFPQLIHSPGERIMNLQTALCLLLH